MRSSVFGKTDRIEYVGHLKERFLLITPKATKKIKNLRISGNIDFSIVDENIPYKGVKGKDIAIVSKWMRWMRF